jgi:serine/threonine-protein kinase
MPCPHCGAPAIPEARFCANCGHRLDAEAVTIAAPEQATFAGTGLGAPPRSPQIAPAPPPSDRERRSSSGWLTSSDSISHGRFAPGAILDGRYRIIGLLGRGGMGEVYRADDLRLGQPVALKFLPDAVSRDAVRLAQFHNEVRTARQVSHPNICRVYDIGEADGQLFLSMEFVDGEDLATSLRRIGRFPEDKAGDIARQLCAGLAAAHERGVIHRDLKPANIMLDDAGNVRVMDFGLAAVGAVEEVRAGTPAYMAPEQLLGREVTARSDIYALGLVLYELFTGRRAFTAATLNDLVAQHESGAVTPPSAIVSTLDPAIERAILRCLDREPARRPASALAVAASLPGGDPLAAALAAGETPSPQMVAAAGEGTGLSRRVAVPLLAAVLIGIATAYALALSASPLERLRPEYTGDVLAQKARDAARALGYTDRPQDEAYGFLWNGDLVDHLRLAEPAQLATLAGGPSPLSFWYRRSPFAMTGVQFHHDLLTPGLVTPDDPAPIWAGMVQMMLDHRGLLHSFEAIGPQVDATPAGAANVDWSPLMTLAGLDINALQPSEPTWHWLASADTRAAWTGTWPGSTHPLRVEAAARAGTPVAFQVIGPWTKPWRDSAAIADGGAGMVLTLFALALLIVVSGSLLARKNLREGRGDRAGALTLGYAIAAALWALWICQVHVAPSVGLLGVFLVTIVTTVFWAVLFWAVYLAVEPFVRRYWPQTLVSWTTVLQGRVRDAIVGRDVLVGAALGVGVALLIRSTALAGAGDPGWPPADILLGLRAAIGGHLQMAIYAIRTALFVFFLLFVLRVVLRNEWAAAATLSVTFATLEIQDSRSSLITWTAVALYFGALSVATVRWGFTTLVTAIFVANSLLNLPATSDSSAWYLGQAVIMAGIPLALAAWAFYRAVGGRLWEGALLK